MGVPTPVLHFLRLFAHRLHKAKTTYLARHREDQKEHQPSKHLYLRPPLISKGLLTRETIGSNPVLHSCLCQTLITSFLREVQFST